MKNLILCCLLACCCCSNAYAVNNNNECNSNGKALAKICSNKDLEKGKVNVCHVPAGGCPENQHTICVSSNSIDNDGVGHTPGEHGGDSLGICATDIDCAGVPRGEAVVDQCGVCGGDDSTCKDCAGVINGQSQVDACGTCGGDGTSCNGCDGIPNSNVRYDECAVCGGDNSTCTDCAGEINGSAVIDDCGVCNGQNNTCQDCAGIPNGSAELDKCGVCNGDGTTCDKVTICHIPEGNPANAHTINVNANALDAHLEHGDTLGECPEGTPTPTPTPSPTPEETPSPTPTPEPTPENPTPTPSPSPTPENPTPTPTPPVVDCLGVPSGSAVVDSCGVCNGNNACLDCAGIPNGGTLVDSCGVCNGPGGKEFNFKSRKKILRKYAEDLFFKRTVPYFQGMVRCDSSTKAVATKLTIEAKRKYVLFIKTLNKLILKVTVCPGKCALLSNKKIIRKLKQINKEMYSYASKAQHGARSACKNTSPGNASTSVLSNIIDKTVNKCPNGNVCH